MTLTESEAVQLALDVGSLSKRRGRAAVIETVALDRFISTKFSISAFSRVCD